MELKMFLAADYATIDASQKLNLLGVFTTIYATQFPVRHELMHLVFQFRPSSGEYGDIRKLRITLVNEDGAQLAEVAGDMKIPEPGSEIQPEISIVIAIRDLVFQGAGTYEFRLYIDKDQKGELPIKVIQTKS